MPRPVLPRLVAWVGAQAGFATVLAAWVGAQAGFATVSGLGRCPGLGLGIGIGLVVVLAVAVGRSIDYINLAGESTILHS